MNSKVRMTRRVGFASGHRYWHAARTREENQAVFGPWASPYNHGHNYVLEATVEGELHSETGMVVNIKRIDAVLKDRVVSVFDNRSINDEVPGFELVPPSIENLLLRFQKDLGDMPDGAELIGIKLMETPSLWGEILRTGDKWTMTLTRTYEFAAAQRLHAPELSDEENKALYGVCNNPEGYGHNYVLEVTVSGHPDPRSGFLCDLSQFDQVVKSLVIDRYDHKCLFRDLPEFEGRITTCENIIIEIFKRLEGALPAPLERIRLWETARNMFEVVA